jgi:hypothetical protein
MSIAALEYVGFTTTADCREYHLRSRVGADRREYTVGITHHAFASGRAKYQDGPAICYEKLERELQSPEASDSRHFVVSEADLLLFQKAHASPQKRRQKPGAAAAATPDDQPGEEPPPGQI